MKTFIITLGAFIVCCGALPQDINLSGDNSDFLEEEKRSLREPKQEWRAVDFSTANQDVWIPHYQEDNIPRRKIKRKRKRRPTETLNEEETANYRRITLDQIKEPWEEIQTDNNQRTYYRRRITPNFEPQEKIRDPFKALQEAEEKQKKKTEIDDTTTPIPDLKTLLKKRGGLSLSEVLQEKNLSLSALLNGNQEAISALAKTTETTTLPEITTKYQRKPPSSVRKDLERDFETSTELSTHEVVEAQRKRLTLLNAGNEKSKRYPDAHKFEVVTETTTEKRIFVPQSKFYTSLDYRPGPVFIQSSSSTSTSSTTRPKVNKLPMTSANLNKLSQKPQLPEPSKLPTEPITINLNELFGFKDFSKNISSTKDEPLKMSLEIEEAVDNVNPTTETFEFTRVTAKEEIMEFMKNPSDRAFLSKVLAKRNMTIDELIQLRERGSSQLHLADIFHNKTREPEPEGDPFIGSINLDSSNRLGRNRDIFSIITSSSTPSSTQPAREETTTKPKYTITSFPTYKIETNKEPYLPMWKQLYPSFFSEIYASSTESSKPTTTRQYFDDSNFIDNIPSTISEPTYDDLDNEMFIKLPTGVKSAILASLAIVGLSLLVFLTILIIFKWNQKQKKVIYTGHFGKFKTPALPVDQKKSFRSFVSETLGRKKNYYKTHLQSMSDSIWVNDEKKSYMI